MARTDQRREKREGSRGLELGAHNRVQRSNLTAYFSGQRPQLIESQYDRVRSGRCLDPSPGFIPLGAWESHERGPTSLPPSTQNFAPIDQNDLIKSQDPRTNDQIKSQELSDQIQPEDLIESQFHGWGKEEAGPWHKGYGQSFDLFHTHCHVQSPIYMILKNADPPAEEQCKECRGS